MVFAISNKDPMVENSTHSNYEKYKHNIATTKPIDYQRQSSRSGLVLPDEI